MCHTGHHEQPVVLIHAFARIASDHGRVILKGRRRRYLLVGPSVIAEQLAAVFGEGIEISAIGVQ
jgi:hypothetical protein